ncbi:hypothetical protein HYH03_012148 [Edaphochlamys debaryana]|uniref:MPN domain-containing protein n=1 Tax=Edaphochlamys debaryana TaxID=47281 RepID=A0A835XSK5_9CHLO|nr:hypothetical protein HYH03_012148 [Edaphochlamys debaryana]|eukprot:KAG2489316.1 hypothetical protein HYH03_012148 [Edaphochlamys debaryana]
MPAVGRPGKPKSLVEHLSEQAPKRAVNDIVSLSRYFMSAKLLLSQAEQYRVIKDEEQLYVMLLRFASLMVETIPRHRDFRDGQAEYSKLKKELCGRYLPELESLKGTLQLKDRLEPPTAMSRNRPSDAVRLTVSDLPQLDWASSGAPQPPPPPPPPQQPALQVDDLLAVMRGEPSAQPTPSSSGQQSRSVPAAYAGPADPYALAAAVGTSAAAAAVELPRYSTSYASTGGRHALFGSPGSASGPGSGAGSRPGYGSAGSMSRYPTLDTGPIVPPSAPPAAPPDIAMLSLGHPSAGPSLGPQEVAVIHMPSSTAGLPDTCTSHAHPPPPPPSQPQPQLPPPQPSGPPPAAAPAPGGPKELAKAAQLRDVHVSVALMEEFLHYARQNTSRGIESCGILAGKLLAGDSVFAITTLIIPKQQGTTDTVQALNEEEIFEAQFERELYPMGWIHTHPTQTCFLSSVDVHTQCGYQTMLDEAVAIVMAPTDRSKRCGIFRLSTPGGLSLVQKCPLRGFHTHPPTDTGQELYELCGHVYLNPRTKHEVLDLR